MLYCYGNTKYELMHKVTRKNDKIFFNLLLNTYSNLIISIINLSIQSFFLLYYKF